MRWCATLCLSALGLAVGCGSHTESEAISSSSPSAEPSAAATNDEWLPPVAPTDVPSTYPPSSWMTLPAGPVPTPTTPAKSSPGPAYFGVDQIGVVRLGVDGSMRKLLSHEYRIHDLVLGPDGRTVWAGGYGGVWRIVGDQVEKVSDLSGYELAPTPDGGLVMLGLKVLEEVGQVRPMVYRYQRGRWAEVTSYQGARRDGLEAWLLHDVAVDTRNRIHLGSSGGWWGEQEGEWRRFGTTEPSLETLFFTEITLGHDGVLFGTCNGGLFYVKPDDGMYRVPVDATAEGFHDVTVAPSGEVAFVGNRDEIVRIRPGEPARKKRLQELGAPGMIVRDVEIDGQSRTWVATNDSVTVLGANDEVLQQWARGTVPEVRGAVRSLVVLGAGPSLPKQHAQITGKVIGRLGRKEFYGYTYVALCLHRPELAASRADVPRSDSSPCDQGTLVAKSKIRRTGEFFLNDVPQGTYWMTTDKEDLKTRCCSQIEGGVLDLGTLEPPER